MTDRVVPRPWWKHIRSSRETVRKAASKVPDQAKARRRAAVTPEPEITGEDLSPPPTLIEVPAFEGARRPLDSAAPHPFQPWNQDVLEKIGQAYDLGEPLQWAPRSTDQEGTVTLKGGKNEYLLHVIGGDEGGALALAAEVELIRFLAEQYFPVATVVKTRAGADYMRTSASFQMLTTAEPATAFQRTSQTHRIESAAGLAQFHELMRDYRGALPLGSSQFLTDSLSDQARWLEESAPAFDSTSFGRWRGFGDVLRDAREEIVSLAEGIAEVYGREPKILVHGAYDPSAVTFDGLGLAGVRNFNHIGYDTRLADLSRSLVAFCSMRSNPGGSDDLHPIWFREFLSTYEQESALSGLEATALPLFIRAHHLIRVVDDCRGLLQTTRRPHEDNALDDIEAEAICLSLRLGRVTRPPPGPLSPSQAAVPAPDVAGDFEGLGDS